MHTGYTGAPAREAKVWDLLERGELLTTKYLKFLLFIRLSSVNFYPSSKYFTTLDSARQTWSRMLAPFYQNVESTNVLLIDMVLHQYQKSLFCSRKDASKGDSLEPLPSHLWLKILIKNCWFILNLWVYWRRFDFDASLVPNLIFLRSQNSEKSEYVRKTGTIDDYKMYKYVVTLMAILLIDNPWEDKNFKNLCLRKTRCVSFFVAHRLVKLKGHDKNFKNLGLRKTRWFGFFLAHRLVKPKDMSIVVVDMKLHARVILSCVFCFLTISC